MTKRVSISLDEEQIELLNSLKGFGTKEAEKVKNIMLAYLSEKGYLNHINIDEKRREKE
jgi:hypothetical protein